MKTVLYIALEETASTLSTQIANANSNISSLQSAFDTAQSKIDALETWKAEADNSIIDLYNSIEARYVGWVTQGMSLAASTTWITIPGLQLNFSLDTEMTVTVRAFGTVRILGEAGAGFRFVIDGNLYGDQSWSERVVRSVGVGASTWVSKFWYIERNITLPAGDHGVRVDIRADCNNQVFQDSYPYTQAMLKVEAR